MKKLNFDGAREALINILCNYQGYKKCEVIVVFDAYKVKGNRELDKVNEVNIVYTKEAETADMYIEKMAKQGIKLSYMDIFFASVVRTIFSKPQLNRFVVNGRVYARNEIVISLAIKKSLTEDGEETIIKVKFDGNESLLEVRNKLEKIIEQTKKILQKLLL